MDELQAAVLRVKLRHLDRWNKERRKKANRYTERLTPLGVVCPFEKKGARHVYHLYVIRTGRRDSLVAFLKKRGIETLVHYPIPIHRQRAYQELGYQKGDLPLTEQYSRKILSLPLFPEIKDSEIEEVVNEIRIFLNKTALPARMPAASPVGAGRHGRPAKGRGESD